MEVPLRDRYIFPAEMFLQQESIPSRLLHKLSCKSVPQAVSVQLTTGLICQFETVLNLLPGRIKLIDVALIADGEDVGTGLVS